MKKLFLVLIFIFISTIVHAKPILPSELFTSPFINQVQINPNGTLVAALFTTDDHSKLSLMDVKTKKIKTILDFNEGSRLTSYQWINDEYLYINYYYNKDSLKGILKINFNDDNNLGEFHKISSPGYLLSTLPAVKDEVLYVHSAGNALDIYQLSIENFIKGEFKKEQEWNNLLSDSIIYYYVDAKSILIGYTYNKKSSEVTTWYRKPSNAKWTKLFTWKDVDYTFKVMGFIDENNLLVLSNKDQEKISAMKFNIPDQSFSEVLYQHEEYDLLAAKLVESGEELDWVTYYSHGQLVSKYFNNAEEKKSKKIKEVFGDKQILTISRNQKTKTSILYVSASDDPGAYYIFDEQKNIISLVDKTYPSLEDVTFAKTQVFNIQSDDSTLIETYLTTPTNYNNGVLLVMPHGDPIGVREVDSYNSKVQYFASKGYSVLRTNFRGSSGFGKNFQKSGIGQFGQLIEKDITTAVNYISNKYHYTHTCSIGASYGGYSSVMLAIKHPEKYDCVVAMFGIYDLPLLFNEGNYRSKPEQRKAIAKLVGEYSDDLKEVSPVNLIDKINVPILLIAGDEDSTAVIEHTNRLYYLLKKHNKDVEQLIYKGVGHGHRIWYGDRHEMAYIDDFLIKKLKLNPPQDEFKLVDIEEDKLLAYSFSKGTYVSKNVDLETYYFKKAALNGDAAAMNDLAVAYEYGKGIEKNLKLAMEWYEKASDGGNAQASFNLGQTYIDESLGLVDEKKSFESYKKAQKQGFNARAILAMGEHYCRGVGVERDLEECLSSFDLDALKKKDDNKNEVNKATYADVDYRLSRIFIMGKLSVEEIEKLKPLVAGKYQKPVYEFSIKEKYYGSYVKDVELNQYEQGKMTDKIPLVIENKLGIEYKLREKDNIDLGLNLFFARWTKKEKNTESFFPDTYYLLKDERTLWKSKWTISEDDHVGDEIRYEVYDIYHHLLYQKTFTLVEPLANP